MADRAMVGDVFKLFPMRNAHATSGLLFVQEGFNKQRGCKNFVAWRIEQIGSGRMRGTDGLALATTQAIGKGICNGADGALLKNKALGIHQPERRCVGLTKVAAF